MGALTAVASILLLGGNFVPGLSQLDSRRQILAHALVFGYAQQVVSRVIDNQAHSMLQSLPGKPPEEARAAVVVTPRRRRQPPPTPPVPPGD